jgi:hypothetical protein
MRKRRIGLLVAWVAATVTATLLASQAVALVRDQVTDRPSKVATTEALETTTSTTQATTSTSQSSAVSSPTTALAETTTTTPATTTSTTQPEVTTTSVTTTTVPTTTSTTNTTLTNQEETFFLTGGWATVRCAGDDVTLATYAPNPGYQVEIESAGPAELEIKFEEAGGDHKSKLEVHCDDGVLEPDFEERDDD